MTDRPPIPEILAAHRRIFGGGRDGDGDYCSCDDWMASTINEGESDRQHREHVSALITEAVLHWAADRLFYEFAPGELVDAEAILDGWADEIKEAQQ